MKEPRYPSRCVERFLDYVTFDTQSDESSESYPSTDKQWVLLRHLVGELEELGLQEVAIDRWGYVTATIPATTNKAGVPTIGFVAHVDTSPEVSGADVKPIVHADYQGQDLVLPDDPTQVLRAADNPALACHLGEDIITASGTTLLGADDKAGVAEIMGLAEVLAARPEIPHGRVRIAFTPDEEIGRGTKHFDVGAFGADCAYTLDGGQRGELQFESFSADSMVLHFRGFNTHPGYAKGRMVSAIKVAASFIDRLPRDADSPETTDGREGYVHPYVVEGGIERTTVRCLIRDFDTAELGRREAFLEKLAREAVAEFPGASLEVEISESYRNMREVLDGHPEVIAHARTALERAGLRPIEKPIRGGTDGSALCFKGLPTPNLFAGEHNFHSTLEWISAADMHKAVEVMVELCRVFEEQA